MPTGGSAVVARPGALSVARGRRGAAEPASPSRGFPASGGQATGRQHRRYLGVLSPSRPVPGRVRRIALTASRSPFGVSGATATFRRDPPGSVMSPLQPAPLELRSFLVPGLALGPAAGTTGFYGQDANAWRIFLRRGLPGSVCDQSRRLAERRDTMAAGRCSAIAGLDLYLVAADLALHPGAPDWPAGALAGVLMPSVDRVGRLLFPLSSPRRWRRGDAAAPVAARDPDWFEGRRSHGPGWRSARMCQFRPGSWRPCGRGPSGAARSGIDPRRSTAG